MEGYQHKIGNKLRLARAKSEYSQRQVAEELNFTEATISRYESGKRSPDYDSLAEFSRLYNVEISYFFEDP